LSDVEYGARYAEEQLRRSRHPFRRFVRGFYVRNVVKDVLGPTIDLGCGAGQVLARLPMGSIGLEVNPHLVESLAAKGMNVHVYDALADDFSLGCLPTGKYQSLLASHVLEHFDDAASVIGKLWSAAARLGVERIVMVVPATRGYLADSTHRTFISLDYIRSHGLQNLQGFVLIKATHFPVDVAWAGRFFRYQELKCVYQRRS